MLEMLKVFFDKVKRLFKRLIKSNFFAFCFAVIISFVLTIWIWTLRIKRRNFDLLKTLKKNNSGYILLFWHGRSMISPYLVHDTKKQVYGIFSKHSDGRLMANIFRLHNVKPIWGSTSSSSFGTIKDALKILKNGDVLAFSPDGPIGPRFTIATDSALYFAMKAKVPIVPLYISGKNAKLINNWDRYMIIKPFSKVGVKLGECFNIPDNLSEDEFKNVKIQLQNLMVKEQQELDKKFGLEKIEPEKFEESKAYRRLKREGKI